MRTKHGQICLPKSTSKIASPINFSQNKEGPIEMGP